MRRASNTISTLFAHALSGNRLGLRRGLGANDADPEFESLHGWRSVQGVAAAVVIIRRARGGGGVRGRVRRRRLSDLKSLVTRRLSDQRPGHSSQPMSFPVSLKSVSLFAQPGLPTWPTSRRRSRP